MSNIGCKAPKAIGWHLIVYLLVFSTSFFTASAFAYVASKQNLVFRHILPQELESIGYINDIEQDAQGFMWFAGNNGLARFDGYELKIYRYDKSQAHSLPHNFIYDLHLTQKGELWLGSRAGLHVFDPGREQFLRLHFSVHSTNTTTLGAAQSKSASIPSKNASSQERGDEPFGITPYPIPNKVFDIFEDKKQRIWLATEYGLYRWGEENQSVVPVYGNMPSLRYSVARIAQEVSGSLWLAHHRHGLTRFHPDKKTGETYRHDAQDSNSLSFDEVRTVYVDERNRVWVGTGGAGLNRYDRERNGFIRYPLSDHDKTGVIWDVIQDERGQIWLGEGDALSLFNESTGEITRYQYSASEPAGLGNYSVRALYEDRAGDIWLGFFPSGVDIVDTRASVFRQFHHDPSDLNSITDGGVNATFEDFRGNLWIGTGAGLTYFNRKNNVFTQLDSVPGDTKTPSGSTVLSILEDSVKDVWLGIWGSGLNRRDPVTGDFTHYRSQPDNPKGLWGKEPWSLLEDSQNDIWIATELGLNRYQRATDDFMRFIPPPQMIDGDTHLYSRVVYEDSFGNLWWGTGKGLFLLDRGTGEFTVYRHDPKDESTLGADFVSALYEDRYGQLWIGTYGGGVSVMRLKDRSIRTFTKKHGLPDDSISGIRSDRDGNIWMGTLNGLSRYDPRQNRFYNFTHRHGLSSNLFHRNTPLLTQYGELVFGNSKGLVLFDPQYLTFNDYVPPVVLTGIQVDYQEVFPGEHSVLPSSILVADQLRLPYDKNALSLTYAALNFRSSRDNRYRYRMVGVDRDWIEAGHRRLATYTQLAPGEYVFEVKGSNNDGVWNEGARRLRITILPPVWRSWWAYTLYCLGAIVLLGGFVWWLRQQWLRQQRDLIRQKAIVSRLKELDRRKERFISGTANELRIPLNGIIGLVEILKAHPSTLSTQETRKTLGAIATAARRLMRIVSEVIPLAHADYRNDRVYKRRISLSEVMDQALDVVRPMALDKGVALSSGVPDGLSVWADEDGLDQMLIHLLHLAIRYTEGGTLQCDVARHNERFELMISNGTFVLPESVKTRLLDPSWSRRSKTSAADETEIDEWDRDAIKVVQRWVFRHKGLLFVQSQSLGSDVLKVELPSVPDAERVSAPFQIIPDAMNSPGRREAGWMVNNAKAMPSEFSSELPLSTLNVGDSPSASAHNTTQAQGHSQQAWQWRDPALRPHIVIGASEPMTLSVMQHWLMQAGFDVTAVDHGVQILAALEKEKVDLLIVDEDLDGSGALSLVYQVRQRHNLLQLPMIVLCLDKSIGFMNECVTVGVNDWLIKPLARDELLARILIQLKQVQMRKRLTG